MNDDGWDLRKKGCFITAGLSAENSSNLKKIYMKCDATMSMMAKMDSGCNIQASEVLMTAL